MQLPSFHIGHEHATRMLLNMALSTGEWHRYETALDLGCGLGSAMILLHRRFGLRVTGYDISRSILEECRRRVSLAGLGAHIECREGNVAALGHGSRLYDVIWCEDVLSHIPNRISLLARLRRNLDPAGVLVFSDLLRADRTSAAAMRRQCDAWRLRPLETTTSYMRGLADAGYVVRLARSGLGPELVDAHIASEAALGRPGPEERRRLLRDKKGTWVKSMDDEAHAATVERLRTFDYLIDGTLHYGFFVCQRDEHRG